MKIGAQISLVFRTLWVFNSVIYILNDEFLLFNGSSITEKQPIVKWNVQFCGKMAEILPKRLKNVIN